jgi:hypothetical protein
MLTFTRLGKYGRLGNQMFQIAASIGISSRNNDSYYLPTWWCSYTRKDMVPFFNFATSKPLSRPLKKLIEMKESHFHYYTLTYSNSQSIDLYGYYQSEKYFSNVESTIRKVFAPSLAMQKKVNLLRPRLKGKAAIHVRRGDYVNNPHHEVCGVDYYQRAMEYAKTHFSIKGFVFFSDDIAWCSSTFPGHDYMTGNPDAFDLHLMSSCDIVIMANSSFSWWAAWLNGKHAICPSAWFGPSYNLITNDLYTEKMIKL